MTIRDNLADNLRRFLYDKRMTQSALAKAVGVGPSSVGNWLKKKDFPTAETFDRLAAVFGVEPEVLLRTPGKTESQPAASDEERLEQLMHSLSALVEKMGYKLVKKP
tara:strand:- start:6026 stop:6346 length:321 start_codon:yes stop_codon:yes gene_type:complete